MKHAVVICGQIGSGKSTIAKLIASQFGFGIVSFGSYMKYRAECLGLPTTRASLQNLGGSLYRTMGPADLLDAVLNYERVGDHDSIVFDGVRHIRVLDEIKSASDVMTSVYLRIGQLARYRRYRMREGLIDLSFSAFQAIDRHHVEVGVAELTEHCDIVLSVERPIVEVERDIVDQLGPVILAE